MPWSGAKQIRSEQDLWGMLFDGELRFRRRVSGVWGPITGPYNNTRFALLPQDATVIRRVSTMRGDAGSNLSVKKNAQPTQFGMAFNDAGRGAFELAFRSQAREISRVAASASAQPILINHLDSWYKLPHEKLATLPTFTGAGGTPALVVGDDAGNDISAEIDDEMGWFHVRADAANISPGDTIEASYDYDALSGFDLDGDELAENIIEAHFTGANESDGIHIAITVRRASVSASGELNAKGEDYANFDFVGDMSQGEGGEAPYSLRWWMV